MWWRRNSILPSGIEPRVLNRPFRQQGFPRGRLRTYSSEPTGAPKRSRLSPVTMLRGRRACSRARWKGSVRGQSARVLAAMRWKLYNGPSVFKIWRAWDIAWTDPVSSLSSAHQQLKFRSHSRELCCNRTCIVRENGSMLARSSCLVPS